MQSQQTVVNLSPRRSGRDGAKKNNGVQMKKFDPSNFYSQDQIDAYVKKLKEERIEWLKRFESLSSAIINALEL